jgi:hypothetical protein
MGGARGIVQVHAAEEANGAVAYGDLAVRAEVGEVEGRGRKADRVEREDLRARIAKRRPERAAHALRTHGVVEHPHAHLALARGDEKVAEVRPDAVRLPDVVLHVDVMRRGGDRALERLEVTVAVVDERDVRREGRQALAEALPDDRERFRVGVEPGGVCPQDDRR